MVTVLPKSHEDRIADLERQVAELKRIVGAPGGGLGGLGGIAFGNLAQAQAAAYQQASEQQFVNCAQVQNVGQASALNQCSANTPYGDNPRLTR